MEFKEEPATPSDRKLKLKNTKYEISIGFTKALQGVKSDGSKLEVFPVKVLEIWENPEGGPDLVRLRRSKAVENRDEEIECFRRAGFTVDDVSDTYYTYITTKFNTLQ